MSTEELTVECREVEGGAEQAGQSRWPVVVWVICGALVLLFHCIPGLLDWLAPGEQVHVFGVRLRHLAGYVAACAFLVSVYCAWRSRFRVWMLAPMLIVAVGIRVPDVLSSTGVGADDFGPDYHRYFWDGSLTANGINPYVYTAEDVIRTVDEDRSIRRRKDIYPAYIPQDEYAPIRVEDPRVIELYHREGRFTVDHMNHPWCRSFYPPVIQGCFALAYWIKPFSMTGWRVVLAVFDVLCAVMVLLLLRRLKLGLLLLSVYLWNPLFPSSGYVGGHMEVVLAPLILLFVWCMLSKRYIGAVMALVLAAGVKLWPVLLVFFVIGQWRRDRMRVLWALGVFFAALGGGIVLPMLQAMGPRSGLSEYSRYAEAIPGAYQLLKWVAWELEGLHGLIAPGQLARGFSTLLIAGYAAFHGLRGRATGRDLCLHVGLVCMLVMLLGPNAWPWYYVLVVPLAALNPRPSLLAWTLLMLIPGPDQYTPELAWSNQYLMFLLAVHLPVWGLLVGETIWFRRRRGAACCLPEVPAGDSV